MDRDESFSNLEEHVDEYLTDAEETAQAWADVLLDALNKAGDKQNCTADDKTVPVIEFDNLDEMLNVEPQEKSKEQIVALDPIAEAKAQKLFDQAVKEALEGNLSANSIQDLVEYYGNRTDIVEKINLRLEHEGSKLRLKKSEPIEVPGAEGNADVPWRGHRYTLVNGAKVVASETVWRAKK